MSGKSNRNRPPAGKSGLSTETTNEGQPHDQNMNPGGSSVAAVVLPHQETASEEKGDAWRTSEDESDAALRAYTELYGDDKEEVKDPPPPHQKDIEVDKDNEEEDTFLLPESQNFPPGTAEDFTEKLRFNGLRWRHEVRQRVKKDPSLIEFLL
jgi:hypothetical protein